MKKVILLIVLMVVGLLLWAGKAFAYSGVPEPATMLLVGLFLVLIAGLGRRKFFKK